MPKLNGKKKQTVTFLRTYHFRPLEKDPIIDRVHTLMDDAGVNVNQAHQLSGVAYGTIKNWIDGPTRRPQYATVAAVVRATGHEFVVSPTSKVGKNANIWAKPPRIVGQRLRNN